MVIEIPLFGYGLSLLTRLLEMKVLQAWDADQDLEELKVALHIAKNKVAKLDFFQMKKNDQFLQTKLQCLVRNVYDIEDILDELRIDNLLDEQGEHLVLTEAIKAGRLDIPHKFVELIKKVKETLKDVNVLVSQQGETNTQSSSSASSYKSPLDLVTVKSRDDDKKSIISKLISTQRKFCGVSIIGIDGLGKTTLARTILEDWDNETNDQNPLVLFACVSGPFNIEGIEGLLEDHSKRPRQAGLSIKHLLRNSTSALIVLDDVWSVEDEDWDVFKNNYLKLCPGSWKILITTRDPKVATETDSTPFYLNKLTDEECKEMIIKIGKLSYEAVPCSQDIDAIAKKCMGIPTLAYVFGVKLSKVKTGAPKKELLKELSKDNFDLWDLNEFNKVLPSLNINNPVLPADLQKFFAYCSLFPHTHEFNKEELIQLWWVEGFIDPQPTASSRQCINQLFEDLLSRSIFQPLKSTEYKEQPRVYKMIEFNHWVANNFASKTFCRVEVEVKDTTNMSHTVPYNRNLRHLSLSCQNLDTNIAPLFRKIEQCKSLRTFLLMHHSKHKKLAISYNFFDKLHRLRVLDLSHTDISELPKPKFPSKHLRYLDLSNTLIKELPKLKALRPALKIFKLKGCENLLRLPKDFNQLINLTHLHVDMKCLRYKHIGMLTKLEVLDSFFVGREEGRKVLELKHMNDLKEVHIFGLENIKDAEEAKEVELSEKESLKKLVLEWDNTSSSIVPDTSDILEALQPHGDLQYLTMRNYGGQKFPTWLISQSCHLQCITLDNCPNCEVLPCLANLPFLTKLVLRRFYKVTRVDDQFCGQDEKAYPMLEVLEFHDMKGLVEWTGFEAGSMPLLCVLKIFGCTMLEDVPSFEDLTCLMKLEINNCPKLPRQKLPSYEKFPEVIITDCDSVEGPKDDHQQPISTTLGIGLGHDVAQKHQKKKKSKGRASGGIIAKCRAYFSKNTYEDYTILETPDNEIQVVQDPDYQVHHVDRKGKQKMEEGSSSNQVQHVEYSQNVTLSNDRDEDNSVQQIEESKKLEEENREQDDGWVRVSPCRMCQATTPIMVGHSKSPSIPTSNSSWRVAENPGPSNSSIPSPMMEEVVPQESSPFNPLNNANLGVMSAVGQLEDPLPDVEGFKEEDFEKMFKDVKVRLSDIICITLLPTPPTPLDGEAV